MIKPEEFRIEDYLNQVYECSCKKTHKVAIREVDISRGALNNVPFLINKFNYKKAFIVSDINTYKAAGKRLEKILEANAIDFCSYVLDCSNIIPNEETIGKIITAFDNSCDLFLAVGAGTINDICKFISFKTKSDYFIIATAPSMDGFASSGAALITNNMKVTYEVHAPIAIIADTDIIKDAPVNMIIAGIGDIIGKYTCLCDWKIANIVSNEYYCDIIVDMVKRSIKSILAKADITQLGNPDIVAEIMKALVLTGIAMSYVGNSRPASGSEHHLSHYWEMMFLFQGKEAVLHGIKVGIATIAVVRSYELLINKKIDFDAAKIKAKAFKHDCWENYMIQTFGAAANSVIELEKRSHKNSPEEVENRINSIENNWNKIVGFVKDALPSSEEIMIFLSKLGAPVLPAQIGVDEKMLIDSINVAKELRQRYGLLQMLFDLGIQEEISIEIKDYFGALSSKI